VEEKKVSHLALFLKEIVEAFVQNKQLRLEVARNPSDSMAEAQSDDQLLRQVCRGDEAAFAEIYSRHQGKIYRFVLHMTGSKATADEVTQETFMLLIRSPKGYDAAKGPLSAYLFGIARNLARRAIQDAYLDVSLDDTEECEVAQSSEFDVLDRLNHSECLELLRKSLVGLPEAYREVVVLCDLEEMTYAQAASVLECSAGTVASRLHRAHTILKTKLSRVTGSKPCLT
jgi:RNA polymerase sigma-70 factor, ECF subfamily